MANQQNQGQEQSSQSSRSAEGQQQGSQSTYWRQQLENEPYYQQGQTFEDYEQAYSAGEQGRTQYGSKSQDFADNEENLRNDYENTIRGSESAVKWDQGGQQACRAAWDRAGSQTQSTDRDMQSQSGSKRTS